MASLKDAVDLLVSQGTDRTTAMEAILADPRSVERLAPAIREFKAQQAAAEAEAKAEAFLETPAGRRKIAEALRAKQVQQKQLAEDARLLLVHEQKLSAEEAGLLSDMEAIYSARLVEDVPDEYLTPAELDAKALADGSEEQAVRKDTVKHWPSMSEEDRREAAFDLGVPVATLAAESAQAVAREEARLYEAVGREVPADVAQAAAGETGDGDGGEAS